MADILDELATVLDESWDAKVLYRAAQAAKKERGATQEDVNEALDVYEHLVRHSNYLLIKAKAAVAQAELPDVEPNDRIEDVRNRLRRMLGRAA